MKIISSYIFGIFLAAYSLIVSGCFADSRSTETSTPTEIWAVELQAGEDPDKAAQDMGAQNLGRIGYLDHIYKFRIQGTRTRDHADTAKEKFNRDKRVKWFEQQIARKRFLRTVTFEDPLFPKQWHLVNTGQDGAVVGEDIHVMGAWEAGFTGKNVVIGIVDDGLQYKHPDIADNYRSDLSYDFNYEDSDPTPVSYDSHGTSAAGLAAARDNTSCGVGVAYRAGLAGLRLVALSTSDADEAAGLSYRRDAIHIYSNSWGPEDDGTHLEGPGSLTQKALEDNITDGRGGLGSIYIWAGGNGRSNADNINYDGYANSRFTIAIGAVNAGGKQAYYSEPGAAMIVTAPSDSTYYPAVTTTDMMGSDGSNHSIGSEGDCTNTFGGTSASAPIAAGVVALMLEANSKLTWRDVQHILIKTAVKVDENDADWVTNGAGLAVNHKYGFGRINATDAVNQSVLWTRTPDVISKSYGPVTVGRAIPDNDSNGVRSQITVTDVIRLEHVEVVFNASHKYRGDLKITLISPAGTKSILAELHNDPNPDYKDWKFMTVRNWDECAAGKWTLEVVDLRSLNTGYFTSWRLILYGTPYIEGLGDAIQILKLLAGMAVNVSYWDISKDSRIGMEEVIYMLQRIAGIRND